MCIIDCLSTIVFILPLYLDYTKVIILILWWRTFQLVSTALVNEHCNIIEVVVDWLILKSGARFIISLPILK